MIITNLNLETLPLFVSSFGYRDCDAIATVIASDRKVASDMIDRLVLSEIEDGANPASLAEYGIHEFMEYPLTDSEMAEFRSNGGYVVI